jgi:hypothetical protein
MDGRPIEKRCYFLKLPAGRTQETAYRHVLTRRGRYRLSGLRVSTKFPFGIIQKSREVSDPVDLVVYPALVAVPTALLRGLPARPGQGRDKWRSRNGDFFGLRDFRPGDDPRDIHWRTTAKRGVLFVRENEDDEGVEASRARQRGGRQRGGDRAAVPGGARRALSRRVARRRSCAARRPRAARAAGAVSRRRRGAGHVRAPALVGGVARPR